MATRPTYRVDAALVDGRRFLQFAAVESDPNASSVGWLRARLAELEACLRSGRSLAVYEPATGKLVIIASAQDLAAWADRHFPVACFGSSRRQAL